jgi:hypothetical protein
MRPGATPYIGIGVIARSSTLLEELFGDHAGW